MSLSTGTCSPPCSGKQKTVLSSSSSSSTPFATTMRKTWKAVEHRFDTARDKFDFDSCTFKGEVEENEEQTTNTTSPSSTQFTNSITDGGGGGGGGDAASREFGSSATGSSAMLLTDDISAKLNIEHSQRLVQRSSILAMNSHRKSGNNNMDTGFQLDQLALQNISFVGRDKEQEEMVQVYNDPAVFLLNIVGKSGVGKSVLAQTIIQKMNQTHSSTQSNSNAGACDPIVCSGKFELYNHAEPYQAIVQAMSGFVAQILHKRGDDKNTRLKQVQTNVQKALGEETSVLVQLIPSLEKILFDQNEGATDNRHADDEDNDDDDDGWPKSNNKRLSSLRSSMRKSIQGRKGQDDIVRKSDTKVKGKTNVNGDIPEERLPVPQSLRMSRRNKPTTAARKSTGGGSDITLRATQIQNIFVEFLGAVCTAEHPLIVILDDIQWAGGAAMALITALLNEANHKLQHLFLITTCRQEYLIEGGEMRNEELVRFLEKHSDGIHQMTIEGLQVEAVQTVINTLLRMDDSSETTGLAEVVHHKTDGNPFFVVQFMRALVDEELLYFERSQLRWHWLEHEITSRNVADNVAAVVSRRLQKLNQEDLFVAQVASCLSRSFELDTLQFVLAGLMLEHESDWDDMSWPSNIEMSLSELSEEGILESNSHTSFSFAHDQLQEAAFRLIPEERKGTLQLAIGKRLIQGLDSFHRDQFLLTAGELCGKGVEQMKSKEKKTFAFWAFLAGDTALKQGAFQLAMKFLDLASDCLGEQPFEDDPELALPLYSAAAEAAYCIADFDKADTYTRIAGAQNDLSVQKLVRLALVKMKVQCGRREFDSAAEVFRQTIKDLGKGKMPKRPNTLAVLYYAIQTSNLLKKYDLSKLSSLPECTDAATVAALSCHRAISASLYVANPNLFIIAACKSTQWSLRHGVSASSPVGLCFTAMLLVSLKEIDKALEVAESALALCEKYNYREALPLTVTLVFGFIRHWSRPMHQFVSPMRYGIEVGNRLGCISDVAVATNTFGILMVLTSAQPLGETVTELEGIRAKLREGKQDDQVCFTECNLQFAIKLARVQNDEAALTSLDGEVMTEEKIRAVAKQNSDVILNAFVDYFKMMLCIYFGNPKDAAKHGEQVVDFGFKYSQGTHMVPRCTFMIGLANALCFKADGHSRNLRTAKAMLKRLHVWVKQRNPNVLHMLQLLEAEISFATDKKKKNLEQTDKEFKKSITSAKRMGFRLDFALFSELYALFQLEASKDERSASYYMTQAFQEYESYGALNKAAHLKRTYPSLMTST